MKFALSLFLLFLLGLFSAHLSSAYTITPDLTIDCLNVSYNTSRTMDFSSIDYGTNYVTFNDTTISIASAHQLICTIQTLDEIQLQPDAFLSFSIIPSYPVNANITLTLVQSASYILEINGHQELISTSLDPRICFDTIIETTTNFTLYRCNPNDDGHSIPDNTNDTGNDSDGNDTGNGGGSGNGNGGFPPATHRNTDSPLQLPDISSAPTMVLTLAVVGSGGCFAFFFFRRR